MAGEMNPFGQRIGAPLPSWEKRPFPQHSPIEGHYCRLEKFDPARHAAKLFAAFAESPDGRDWTYLPYGPFTSEAEYFAHMQKSTAQEDPLHHAILVNDNPVGSVALQRIDRDNGVMEVGHVCYSTRLQRTPAGTEAQFLLMRRAFDELGYRRYEWKCDSLNLPSRRAAERFGFQYEGTFRQAIVYKGRSRDTAWFSIIDRDWPVVRAAFEAWLAPESFVDGKQVRGLAEIRKALSS